uniref:XPG N-terminal domain-containing protein n=1 Tax=viral metagenome TaxID=1070528 RepID=A0A6C0H6E4_9ZZZZ
MAIELLNKFLKQKTMSAIKQINLKELKNKTLVIDASIYMFKYKSENKLCEKIEKMISILLNNGINPIFVFDGSIMENKKETIKKRKKIKQESILKISYYENKENLTPDEKIELKQLKLNSTTLTIEDRINVKSIVENCKIEYFESNLIEADKICDNLIKNKKAWGCISDDMDMFAYGMPFILRDLNIDNETVVLYDTNKIINILNISMENFKNICLLSGNDQFPELKNNIFKLFNYFEKFKKKNNKNNSFIDWLSYHYIDKINYNKEKFGILIKYVND